MRSLAAAVLLLSAYPADRLAAQAPSDTARAATGDTTHVAPLGAFWRSLVLPGWGQATSGRHVTGAAFVAWEGIVAMMTLKAQQEVNYLKAVGSPSVPRKRQEVQDWLVLWIFNHLFSGAEAFVSAHLRDFPPELQIRAVPSGVGLSLPLPRP